MLALWARQNSARECIESDVNSPTQIFFGAFLMTQLFKVLVFMNSSYRPLEEFCSVAFPLVDFTVQEMLKAEVETLKILFGDNYRYC